MFRPLCTLVPQFVLFSTILCLCEALSSVNPLMEGETVGTKKQQVSILVVGASGGTGLRALNGFLDVGYAPNQIRVLTRNRLKPSMVALQEMGFETCQANLEDPSSLACNSIWGGCVGCYVHSTSSDTQKLDTMEVQRARNLAAAMASSGSGIRTVVYNSAAAAEGHGVFRIEQKHRVEKVFGSSPNMVFTSLRANLFMEEFWKKYTRPSLLKGKFPFSVPSARNIYLTSVRDMGRLAGTIFMDNKNSTSSTPGGIFNVASDILTPPQMARAFGEAQGSPCKHVQNQLFALITKFFFKDLHEVIRFYRTSEETTDIPALEEKFPGLLTPFHNFLEETQWVDKHRTYDDLGVVDVTSQLLRP